MASETVVDDLDFDAVGTIDDASLMVLAELLVALAEEREDEA